MAGSSCRRSSRRSKARVRSSRSRRAVSSVSRYPTVDCCGDFRGAAGGTGGSMPVLDGQTIIVAGVGVTAIRPSYRDGAWTVQTLWETKDVATYLSNPVVIGDTLFGFSTRNSGQLYAVDAP